MKNKVPIIILEGCDNVGKSSIAEILKKHGIVKEIIHNVAPKTLQECTKKYNQMVLDMQKYFDEGVPVLYDRAFLSERVYTPIIKNYKQPNMRNWELRVANICILFVITRDYDLVKKGYEDDYLPMHHLKTCLKKYSEEFYQSRIFRKYYLPNNGDIHQVTSFIITKVLSAMNNDSILKELTEYKNNEQIQQNTINTSK